MMGKIYAHASGVSIWFGNEDREPPDFVQTKDLRSVGHIGAYGRIPISLSFIAQALRNARGPKHRLATLRPVGDSVHRNTVYGFPNSDAPEWDTIRQFFTNAWFERVWVVQEAVLASKATVLIGDWEIEWAAIGEAAVWFQSEGQATNPKDKVYATFGIAEELAYMEENGLHQLLEPDYRETKTVAEVYRDIAIFLIIEYGHLGVLSHVGKSLEPDWPSWVPDWRQDKASNILSIMQGADTHNASRDQSLQVGISENPYTISLQGVEADVITAYGDKLASYGFGYVTYKEEIEFARAAWDLSQSIHTSDSNMNGSISSTFIQTLVTGFSTEPSFQEDALQWFAQHAQLSLNTSRTRRLKYLMKKRSDPGRFHEIFVQACVDRRFFVTKNGLMGVGPDGMKEGDAIGILFGGRVPYVLRPVDNGFRFVGECYVSGLMNGEAVQTWKDEGSKKHVFELVQA
ncbi:hypothetical protein SNOG_02026 [Parastagonospora nodorum SN15]|uniref:Heterokaryon incompatibility domain-containing protein n=1 Tax=Phaeosphaeria nodorum (strain SN15 / ATCC MYA-4574 / FGSC 10173) TaxID=321614 RepID=Q0V1T8_PHANO|nr:hypothetical protein SNOG_02026 [Parastagonospora nodorum SN15]EAT90238.2 hypothetical protein SNOG_02026 [Parastagonospora nodorum SN15]